MADAAPTLRPAARPRLRYRTGRAVLALMLREMSATYGRTPGGYIWAVLEPVAIIVVLALAFSLLLRSPGLGTSFILFYASAVLPLRFYQVLQASIAATISFNKSLLFYPRVTFVDSMLSRLILGLLTQTLVNVIVIVGIFYIENIREIINIPRILFAYVCATWLAVGVGAFNAYMTFNFQLYGNIWKIASRPLLLLSGVFYLYEDLPEFAQNVLWYNPLIHVTGMSRDGYFVSYSPEYISLIYIFTFGLVPMFFGFLLLRRFAKDSIHR